MLNSFLRHAEARNVQADTASQLSFYVKLRLGPSEASPDHGKRTFARHQEGLHLFLSSPFQVKTEIASNTESPKFLKDVRMNVPNPETDVLRVRKAPTCCHPFCWMFYRRS